MKNFILTCLVFSSANSLFAKCELTQEIPAWLKKFKNELSAASISKENKERFHPRLKFTYNKKEEFEGILKNNKFNKVNLYKLWKLTDTDQHLKSGYLCEPKLKVFPLYGMNPQYAFWIQLISDKKVLQVLGHYARFGEEDKIVSWYAVETRYLDKDAPSLWEDAQQKDRHPLERFMLQSIAQDIQLKTPHFEEVYPVEMTSPNLADLPSFYQENFLNLEVHKTKDRPSLTVRTNSLNIDQFCNDFKKRLTDEKVSLKYLKCLDKTGARQVILELEQD